MSALGDTIGKLWAYTRGFLVKTRIHTLGPIKSYGKTVVRGSHGQVIVGRRSCLWPGVVFDLAGESKDKRAVIRIGEYSSIGDRTEIHCAEQVTIGSQVLIAWDVNIIENDYHAAGGGKPIPVPIVIEDEVWIGARAIITKGVTIGRGAIIGAGSVVTRDVPPFHVAAGNPARVLKPVKAWTGSSAENLSPTDTGSND